MSPGLPCGVRQERAGDERLAEHVRLKLQDAVDQPQQSEHKLAESRDPCGRSACADAGSRAPIRDSSGLRQPDSLVRASVALRLV
jgi:hypothetical protein